MILFRSVVFTVIMFVSVPPYSLVVVLGRLFGVGTSYSLALLWVRFTLWMCKLLCNLDFTVEGQDHIPDQTSVVFLKHSSAFETLAQFLIFPKQSWILKQEIMWAPFLGWAVAAVSPIAINRRGGRSSVEQVIAKGTRKLERGIWIMIFPEGTRSAPGQSGRYGLSGCLLAQESKRLIIPVAHNAGDFWPRRGWRKKPGTIRFVIGPPFDPADRDPREVTEEIKSWIETKVAEIRNPD